MTVGLNGPRMLISHIKQGKGSVADHPMWERIQQKRDGFEVTCRGWFDFGGIREAYAGVPIPGNELKEGLTVGEIIEALGLGNAGAYTFAAGYKGRAFHSETEFDAPGERTGLLKLLDQKSLTLDDLPPLPLGSTNLCAKSLDLEQLYDTIIDLVRKGAEMGPPEGAEQVEGLIGAIPDLIGFDPKGDLLSCLGGTWTVYPEPRQGGIFGMGLSIVCSVREAKQLQETVGELLERGVESAQNDFVKLSTTKKRGREVTTVQLAGVFAPSIAVDKEWMIISLTPQTVESFLMRVDGKLEKWSPSPEQEKALAEFPKSFTSLTISDPRVVYEAVSSAAPFLFGLLQQIPVPPDDQKLGEILNLSVADIPPAELVGKPLFPNVSMTVLDEKGCRTLSRQSAPSFPLMGNSASVGSIGTISVLTALLLPAVQQAREAARRTQSQNNLKQIGLSLHNYHDVNNTFPRGTVENEDLEDPEDRLSWLVEVLPYLEEAILFEKLDLTKGSKDEANQEGLSQALSVFMSPSQKVQEESELGRTDYVGIAGVGEEELTTEEITAKSGVFGYNRRTEIRDITDGTSNTIMVMDVSKNPGPWGVGGPSTVRALTKAPYINGPDGLGGVHRGGAMVLFADGSVRFISEAVDDEVMEGLVTIQGGENVSPD